MTHTPEEYEHMLAVLLDAHYGAAVHHIGNGDGISEPDAKQIREFWELYLDQLTRAAQPKNGRRK